MDYSAEIKEYIAQAQPSTAYEHAMTQAYCSGTWDCTQRFYAECVGINDRSLRKYIKDNRGDYDKAVKQAKEEREDDIFDVSSLKGRQVSEEDIDRFVSNIIKKSTSENSTVREWQFLTDFLGLSAEDILTLNHQKKTSLRHMIKDNLITISQYLDTRELGIQINESQYLYRGDRNSSGNTQSFVNADIADRAFRQELMYWGLIFMSLYNQQEHPDLELLSTATRLQRIQDGTASPLNKAELKIYASGGRHKKKKTDEELEKGLTDLYGKAEARATIARLKEARDTVKPPQIDKEDVQQRASQHEDDLQVFLSTEEELRAMFKKAAKENK